MLVEQQKINKRETIVVTSLDVAETFGKEHRRVLQDIKEMECSDNFREHNFVLSKYTVEDNRRTYPMYYITRDGFTMLAMGYTGENAMKFKEAYIRQFNEMEKMLIARLIEREKGIVIRQTLTKAIQSSNENVRMHGHAYSRYTELAYNAALKKTAKQLRKELEIREGDSLRDYLTLEEIERVKTVEHLISALLDANWEYGKIRDFVLNDYFIPIKEESTQNGIKDRAES